ncbi:hypothetical protein [Thalassobaculum sp.]|uniref:COG3904 family protein n=1 Tax=Thalassobaculum sp. TaxID=2022740 RepID=UPI0032EDB354
MDRSLIRLLASLVALFALTSVAHALQLDRITTKQGTILTLSGEFVAGDANKVLDALSREPIMEVRLHSPGGNMKAGIDVGVTLRAAQVATRITSGRECASACFFAFLGGVLRSVDGTGRLGVHMHSAAGNDEYVAKLRQILSERRMSVDDRIRLIVLLNEQMSARIAGMIATYVVRMGVAVEVFDTLFATSHLDIHWLSEQEMRRFNVVNVVG